MKTISQRPINLVEQQIVERHQRPVIVRSALGGVAERPDRRGQNLSQVMEASNIRIAKDLVDIVVNEAVPQRIQVRHDCDERQHPIIRHGAAEVFGALICSVHGFWGAGRRINSRGFTASQHVFGNPCGTAIVYNRRGLTSAPALFAMRKTAMAASQPCCKRVTDSSPSIASGLLLSLSLHSLF